MENQNYNTGGTGAALFGGGGGAKAGQAANQVTGVGTKQDGSSLLVLLAGPWG